jgi:hypothetical protein
MDITTKIKCTYQLRVGVFLRYAGTHCHNIIENALSHVVPKRQKHTTGGIPRWSPTLVLVARFSAYVWQSGRDAQFSLTYGRMCWLHLKRAISKFSNFWPQARE